MKRIILFLFILITAWHSLATADSGQLLFPEYVWRNPDEYVFDKGFANYWWNVDLFCATQSGAQSFVMSPSNELYHSAAFFIDPCFNRLLFLEKDVDSIRSYGSYGSAIGQYKTPIALDAFVASNPYYYSYNYNIFVADRDNHRIQWLKYRWTEPYLGLIHQMYFTHQDICKPIDVDIDDNGTLWPDLDDYVWVASQNDIIAVIGVSAGYVQQTYGGTGSGIGQFNEIHAITCGRSFFRGHADSDTVYVADAGNSRIVRLYWQCCGAPVWIDEWSHPYARYITDIEADIFGQLWALSNSNCVLKFTSDLEHLGTYGSSGTGPDQFNKPVSIANSGGYKGGGNMLITEQWDNESGIRYFAIGTGISCLHGSVIDLDTSCFCNITFTLLDWSGVTIYVYDDQDNLVRRLYGDTTFFMMSGTQSHTWDGIDDWGYSVQHGDYRVEVTAISPYISVITGEHVNTAIENTWVTMWEESCDWLIGDADYDGNIDISDVVYLVNYVFVPGSPAPQPLEAAGDADCTGVVENSDAVYLVQYIFVPGSPPPGDPDNDGIPDCRCEDWL